MRSWAVRCVHESQLYERNSFLTLTFDDAHIPDDWSIRPRHWQLFAKKLRRLRGPFRYFAVGEYGDRSLRPHYHALIFGLGFDDLVKVDQEGGEPVCTSPELVERWGQGFVTVGNVTYRSAAYCASYALKKVGGEKADEHYQGRHPEFRCASVGLGRDWIKQFKGDVFNFDEVTLPDGRKFRPPKYYERELLEHELEAIQKKRLEHAHTNPKDLTAERLRVRELVAQARERHFRERKL